MEENNRAIPHSLDAEKSVLGSILLSTLAAEKALELLNPEDFYSVAHRDIFFAMERLYNAGKLIDTVTLVDMLEKQGKLEAAGGTTYITELALYTPSASNIDHYINIVEGHSIRRKLISVGSTIAQDASETAKDTSVILNDAERMIYDIAMRKTADPMERIDSVYTRVYNQIGEYMQLDGRRTGISTGLIDLDELTSGLQRSDLIIVAGRPATGKSAFALNIAAHAAIREKATVAIFSLEMSKEQLVMRIMASESDVNMQKLRTGDLGATELLKIADRFNTVGESNILIDDTPGVTVAEIRSKCRRIQAIHGLDMVIIDYLQLMQSGTKRDSRVLEISEMTRGLKILARELNIAVVLLSQLSREPDKRKDHTPIMSDLRESGSIEQDADVIMMLYRPAAYPDTEEAMNGDNTAYINVAKHRNGATASLKVTWVPELTKYANYAEDFE
ncbi:MAG: replicative DNA helicase [Christensenellaceae bacterium]|nr:replicative DNA helicase [Christensenellaceae bacterium]